MKTRSLFFKVYIAVLVIFALALSAFLIVFHGWLKSYEAGRPEQLMTAFVNDGLKGGEIAARREEYNISVSPYETDEAIKSTVSEMLAEGEPTFSTTASKPEDCKLAYSVKCGDSKLMSVYFKRDDKKRYKIAGIAFEKKLYKSFKISVPSNAELSVNGVRVDDSDRKNEDLPEIVSDFADGSDIIYKQSVTLENMLGSEPKITAVSGGTELSVEKSETDYTAVQSFPEREGVSDIAGKAASIYADYMQNDSSIGQIRKYMDTETDFYKNLRTSLVYFVLDHQKHEIKDLKTADFHKYSDELFSCRVTLANELTRNGVKYRDMFDKYVYLRRDGNSYKVLDMQNTGGSENE